MDNIFSAVSRAAIRGLVRVYYPAIEFSDRERLRATGPLLIVANHANSLMDPVVLGLTARRPVHFLAKAPLFNIPLFGKLLHALGMIPAYRASDDSSQLQKNVKSLADAARWLVNGDAVGIFPEGKSHDLYHIEQVRTGAARIALQAIEMGAKELQLVPIGINYERKERFGSAIWVRVGEPLNVNSWLKQNADKEPKQAVRALTLELDTRLQELVVHLHEPKWEPFLADLELLRPPTGAADAFGRLRQRKRVADAINHFLLHDRSRGEAIAARIEQHRSRLAMAGLAMDAPLLRLRGAGLALHFFGKVLVLIVEFPIALAGTLHHLVPFFLTRLIAGRFQVPGRSTVALSRLLIGLPIYAGWYACTGWWIARRFSPWVATAWLMAMPLAGLVALNYWRRTKNVIASLFRQLRLVPRRSELDGMRSEHDQLCAELERTARTLENPRLAR